MQVHYLKIIWGDVTVLKDGDQVALIDTGYDSTFESIKQYPYKLGEDFDLIITTPTHAEYLETVLPESKKPVQVALRPSARSLSKIIKIDLNNK